VATRGLWRAQKTACPVVVKGFWRRLIHLSHSGFWAVIVRSELRRSACGYCGTDIVVAVLIGRFLVRQATLSTPKAQDLSLSMQTIGAMSGGQLKVFVAQVLRALGYRTTVLGGSGDQGVDIIAATNGGKVAIQCKNYRKPVGNKPVYDDEAEA
jgi:HJR/Mrr/RecB family endonuclease